MNDTLIKKYLNYAGRAYCGHFQSKKRFLNDLQDALLCYAETTPDFSYEDLLAKFGTAAEIRSSF